MVQVSQKLRRVGLAALFLCLCSQVQVLNAATDRGQEAKAAENEVLQNPQITVIGSVADARTDDPIIGASISVKGVAGKGTITDVDGKFFKFRKLINKVHISV